MQFNCGPSPETLRQRRWAKIRAKRELLKHWHLKFAWWPTRVAEDRCVWLEHYKRRCTWYTTEYQNDGFWQWELMPHQPGIGLDDGENGTS